MTISGRCLINRAAQVQITDDCARTQIEMGVDQLFQLCRTVFAAAKRFHIDAQWMGNANRVSNLHFATVSQASGDDVFGNPTGRIRRAAVNFGAIFAAERATAVPSHATIGIHNNFTAS